MHVSAPDIGSPLPWEGFRKRCKNVDDMTKRQSNKVEKLEEDLRRMTTEWKAFHESLVSKITHLFVIAVC
jgi:hypothetical protein